MVSRSLARRTLSEDFELSFLPFTYEILRDAGAASIFSLRNGGDPGGVSLRPSVTRVHVAALRGAQRVRFGGFPTHRRFVSSIGARLCEIGGNAGVNKRARREPCEWSRGFRRVGRSRRGRLS